MKISRRQPKPCEPPKVVVEVEEKPPVIKKKVGKK
jgi:hypothetical protein